jgi:hypothetical protein
VLQSALNAVLAPILPIHVALLGCTGKRAVSSMRVLKILVAGNMSQPAIFGAVPAAGGELVGLGDGDGLGAGDPVGDGLGAGEPVGPGEGVPVGDGDGDVVGVPPTGGAAPLSDPPPPQAAMSDKNTMLADKGFKTRTTCAAGEFDCCLFVDILRHLNAVWLRGVATRVGSRVGALTKQLICEFAEVGSACTAYRISAIFMRFLGQKWLERRMGIA